MTSHCVFGAGLIGCYLGGVLAGNGAAVQLVARQAVKDKLRQGLHLSDYLGNQLTLNDMQVLTCEWPKNKVDYLWLTVKCTQLEQAAEQMRPWVSERTVILCAQNGLGAKHIIQRYFPRNQILSVVVPFNVVEQSPGKLHRASEGIVMIESSIRCLTQNQKLVQCLSSPLLPSAVCENMPAMAWAKLQLNLSNAVNALSDRPLKSMLEDRGYRLLIADAMQELLQVVKAKGLTLPRLTALPAKLLPLILRLPNGLFTRLASKMLAIDPQARLSMWWDLQQGKPTEVDFLNGAVVAEGARLGIACPVNQALTVLVHQAEQSCDENRLGLSAAALRKRVETQSNTAIA